MKRMMIIIIFIIFYEIALPAPIFNKPIEIEQADGAKYSVFITGDEYGSYIHNSEGYLIGWNIEDKNWYYVGTYTEFMPPPPPGTKVNTKVIEKYWLTGKKYGELLFESADNKNDSLDIVVDMSEHQYEYTKLGEGFWDFNARSKMMDVFDKPINEKSVSERKIINKGNVTNPAILVSFASLKDLQLPCSGDYTVDEVKQIEKLFNKTEDKIYSLRKRYNLISYGNLDIVSKLFPSAPHPSIDNYAYENYETETTKRLITLDLKGNSIKINVAGTDNDYMFFMPNKLNNSTAVNNPIGYNTEEEGSNRLGYLKMNIIKYLKNNLSEINTLNLDVNKDGAIDNITFVFRLNYLTIDKQTILWPKHSTYASTGISLNNSLLTHDVQLLSEGKNSYMSKELTFVQTATHELAHSLLQLADMYCYNITYSPLAGWSNMSGGVGGFTGFEMSDKNGVNWVKTNEIKEIDLDANSLKLYSIDNANKPEFKDKVLYKIRSPYSETKVETPFIQDYSEYFLLEYRSLLNELEKVDLMKYSFIYTDGTHSPDSGLLLYKINDKAGQKGNFYTDKIRIEDTDDFFISGYKCKNRVYVPQNNNFHILLDNATFPANGYSEINDFGTTSAVFGTTLDNENAPVNRGGLIIRNITHKSDPDRMEFDLFFFDSRIEIVGETIREVIDDPETGRSHLEREKKLIPGTKLKLKVVLGDENTMVPKDLVSNIEVYNNDKVIGTIENNKNEPVSFLLPDDCVPEVLNKDNYIYAKVYGKKGQVESTRKVYLEYITKNHINPQSVPSGGEKGGEKKSSIGEDINKKAFEIVCTNLDSTVVYTVENSQFYYKAVDGNSYTSIPTTINKCVWDVSNLKSGQYYIKANVSSICKTESGYNYIMNSKDSITYDLYRPISLGTISMVFKKPDDGGKYVYGTNIPLEEIDTLRVTVPRYATEPEYWGGVEILMNGEYNRADIAPAEPPYTSTDSTRVYKFVWDYSEQPEGFVTMRARYVDDPLSFDQKKVKVAYTSVWEDFENGMGNWTLGTQYAYPPGNGPESHYWRTSYKDDIKSIELRTSTASFTAQRFGILSPPSTVPSAEEDVQTFLTFDYARELGSLVFGGGRSMMIV